MPNLKNIMFSRIAPRTDAKNMTCMEIIKSGLIYFVVGVVFFMLFVYVDSTNVPSGDIRHDDVSSIALVIMIVSMLIAAMGIIGGAYLLIRAFFKFVGSLMTK